MHVLLCAISPGTCSLTFAISMLRLQVALQSAPGVRMTVDVAPDLRAAIRQAAGAKDVDVLVAIDSCVGFPSAFVLRALVADCPFVTGIYPLPTLDWDRVERKGGVEDVRFRGNTYNVNGAKATPAPATGYLSVRRAGLRAVVLKRAALDALDGGDARDAREDDELCAAWKADIWADLDNQCTMTGPMEFTGCAGARSVLR